MSSDPKERASPEAVKIQKVKTKILHQDIREAIRKGNIDFIRLALDDVDISARSTAADKGTMLHFAAFHGKRDIVELLIARNADPNLKEKGGRTALFLAAMKKNEDVALYLLPRTEELSADKRQDTVLHQACRNGLTDLTQAILGRKPDMLLDKNESKATPLVDACFSGNLTSINTLIEHKATPNGDCLLAAAQEGHDGAVEDLLTRKVSPDAKTTSLRSPLHIAASRGHPKVVTLLLSALLAAKATVDSIHTQKPTKEDPLPHTTTALMVAAHKGHDQVVRQLLHAKADVNFQKASETALVMASWGGPAEGSNIVVVNTLLDHKANVNDTDSRKRTPLILAANSNRIPVIKRLLAEKADLEMATAEGHTALFAAVLRKHLAATTLLLRHGADPDVTDKMTGKTLRESATKAGINIDAMLNRLRRALAFLPGTCERQASASASTTLTAAAPIGPDDPPRGLARLVYGDSPLHRFFDNRVRRIILDLSKTKGKDGPGRSPPKPS